MQGAELRVYNWSCLIRTEFYFCMPKTSAHGAPDKVKGTRFSVSGTLGAVLLLCLALGATTGSPQVAHAAEQRVALVIGNDAYPSARLRNAVNDANAMAAKLRTLGFDVILRTEVTQREMSRSISEFGKKLSLGSIGLFYFAGHGMQVRSRNFLIPVDAEIESEGAVRGEAVDVEHVLDQLGPAKLSIVVLDACRNNPFESRFRRTASGLAQIDAPTGNLLAYATAPGRIAADGTGSNGLYTAALLRALDTPGLGIGEVFRQVRNEVIRDSGNKQIPWESSSLTTEFYFQPGSKVEIETVRLQLAEKERAELLREVDKLRTELAKVRTGTPTASIAAAGALSTDPESTKPSAAGTDAALLAMTAPASARPAVGTPAPAWGEHIARLEKFGGQLTLFTALAVLLDIVSDDELGLLLLHENYVKGKGWNNAYAMGVDDNGNLTWGGAFRLQTIAWASEAALEQCTWRPGYSCSAIVLNGRFDEQAFLRLARSLGKRDIAAARDAFVRSLAQLPVETTIGLSGAAGGGGGGTYAYSFGYSSLRR